MREARSARVAVFRETVQEVREPTDCSSFLICAADDQRLLALPWHLSVWQDGC
jgi:hypothetical protein